MTIRVKFQNNGDYISIRSSGAEKSVNIAILSGNGVLGNDPKGGVFKAYTHKSNTQDTEVDFSESSYYINSNNTGQQTIDPSLPSNITLKTPAGKRYATLIFEDSTGNANVNVEIDGVENIKENFKTNCTEL